MKIVTSFINRHEKLVVFRFIPYEAVSLYPLIVVRHKRCLNNAILLNHERIHHRQQVELFILPFYILYGLNYLVNLVRFMNHNKAYQEILFEQEAYTNEQDLHYLTVRNRWAWLAFKL